MPIRIVIADDHKVVRDGLQTILADSGLDVVQQANSGKGAVAAVKESQPNVAVLDVRMPEGDGLEALARIKLDMPQTHVLMFSSYDNPSFIARAVALGASGYLTKQASSKEVVEAVRSVSFGESIWTREQLRRVANALSPLAAGSESTVFLTKRENEVLRQIAYGLTNKEIAETLGISYETVKEHVQRILKKIGVTDRTQAAVWAVRNQLA